MTATHHNQHLLHPFSSEPSLQSFSPSHFQPSWMQPPSSHWNSACLHLGLWVGQPISSELSWQSLSPSQCQVFIIHRPLPQVNCVGLQDLLAANGRE